MGWKDAGIQTTDYEVVTNYIISRFKDDKFDELTQPSNI
jgi:hypothetical protein